MGSDQGDPRPVHRRRRSFFQTGQTIFAGLSYYGILAAAYPGEVTIAPIVTAYAVGVAVNNFLPANIGTFVTLLMFVAIIPSCTLPGSIAAYLVQKIFFTVAGTFVYLYLFLSVPGSFDFEPGQRSRPIRALTVLIVAGAVYPDRARRARVLAAGEEALGAGEAGRRDPLAAEALLHACLLPVVPLVRRASTA